MRASSESSGVGHPAYKGKRVWLWAGCPHPACRGKERVRVGKAGWGHPAYISKIRSGCGRGDLTPHSIRESVLHSDAALRGRPPFYDVIRSGLYEYRLGRDLGLLNPV